MYQERILSRRVVHFGTDQIHWECKSAFLQEDGTSYEEPSSLNRLGVETLSFKSTPYDTKTAWRKMVTEYTQLALTYESDRLPAISAVVEKYARFRPDDVYVAGMWFSEHNNLLEDLAWYTTWKQDTKQSFVRSNDATPTWSWASISTPVFWSDNNWRENTELLSSPRLLDMGYVADGPAHVGRVKYEWIRMSGPSFAALLYYKPSTTGTGEDEPHIAIEDPSVMSNFNYL